MKTLRDTRIAHEISQQELSRLTGIHQVTISNLEREIVAPTCNQITLLEKVLGPLEWPQNREFSDLEKMELVQAFHVLVHSKGPRKAVNLFASARNNDDLRGIAALFSPQIGSEDPLPLPNHYKEGGLEK